MNSPVATAQIFQSPSSNDNDAKEELKRGRYILGIGFILAQCVVWIAASVLTQYMFNESDNSSPFLMTYTGVALMMIFLPVHWISERLKRVPGLETCPGIEEVDSFDQDIAQANAYSDILTVMQKRSLQHATSTKKWNHKKHVLAALK